MFCLVRSFPYTLLNFFFPFPSENSFVPDGGEIGNRYSLLLYSQACSTPEDELDRTRDVGFETFYAMLQTKQKKNIDDDADDDDPLD